MFHSAANKKMYTTQAIDRYCALLVRMLRARATGDHAQEDATLDEMDLVWANLSWAERRECEEASRGGILVVGV